MTLRLSDYDYPLPEKQIAYYPPEKRVEAKLLVCDRKQDRRTHRRFFEILQEFNPGDVLVLNDTQVIPARLLGKRESGKEVEVLLIKDLGKGEWEVLIRPGGKYKKGDMISLGLQAPHLLARVLDDPQPGVTHRRIVFDDPGADEWIEKYGHMPLPPYINRKDEKKDRQDYQTVFARQKGAVAAPTAGLHFDEMLLTALHEKGVEIICVTLHVGYGTFQPVSVDDVTEHQMHSETFFIHDDAVNQLNEAMQARKRIVACGTTTVRVLESAIENRRVVKTHGETDLFIYPSYQFKVVDGLITNFHLPKSTLLLLVDAFLGGNILEIYKEALESNYQFYSYGDAMLIQ